MSFTAPKTASKRASSALMHLCSSSALVCAALVPMAAHANPAGGTVVGGQATISTVPNRVTINQTTDKAIINWNDFSIGQGETTQFVQPNKNSIALNRVTSQNPSTILGNLTANGQVMLVNPNGVFFGKTAKVDVSGLVATTSDIDNKDFMKGNYHFSKPGNTGAKVINEGTITVRDGGLAAFVAPNVRNDGLIVANVGKVELAAGEKFTLDLYGDNLVKFEVSDNDSAKIVEQKGTIQANGGRVALTVQDAKHVVNNVINMDGVIEAGSATVAGGEIILGGPNVNVTGTLNTASKAGKGGKVTVTGDNIKLASSANINTSGKTGGGKVRIGGNKQGQGTLKTAQNTTVAQGATIVSDATDKGDAGSVIVWADQNTIYSGAISAKGGKNGGNGGFVEVSGKQNLGFYGDVDMTAPKGQAGTLLLDPDNVIISGDGTNNAMINDNVLDNTDQLNGDLYVSSGKINTILNNGNNVYIQANDSIALNQNINKSAGGDSTLTFDAPNIYLDAVVRNTSASLLNLTGTASYVTVSDAARVQQGIDFAASGATVDVATGTYAENLIITKSLTLQGAGVGNTVIRTADNITAQSVVDYTGTTEVRPVIAVNNAGTVNISGISVNGSSKADTNDYFTGIGYINTAGTIDNVRVAGINGPTSPFGGTGIFVQNDDGGTRTVNLTNSMVVDSDSNSVIMAGPGLNVNVTGNDFRGRGVDARNTHVGLYLYEVSGTVDDNRFSQMDHDGTTFPGLSVGIYLSAVDGVTVTRNRVIGDSTLTDHYLDGIYVMPDLNTYTVSSNDVTIQNNRFVDVNMGANIVNSNGVKFLGNKIDGAVFGMYVYNAPSILIRNNDFIDNQMFAASLTSSSNV